MSIRSTITMLAAVFVTGIAAAEDMKMAAGIAVTDAWSRATPGIATPGVVYLTITDTGAKDRVTGASTPVAAMAHLHQSRNENGVEKMLPVDGIDVAPGAPVKLEPGGYHLMLMGLKQPLKAGDQFPVTLTFEHAGAVTTTVTVRSIDGTDAKPMGGMDMKHM
jgi:hypothetical protein